MNEDLGREIGWDEPIEQEGQEFEILPAGTYEFTVESMERGRYPGSERMAACNCANLALQIRSPKTWALCRVFDTLYLNSKAEWRLSQFFLGIGQKKKGEPLRRPNWGAVPGATGKVEIEVHTYKDKNGNDRTNNRVVKYLPYESRKFVAGEF